MKTTCLAQIFDTAGEVQNIRISYEIEKDRFYDYYRVTELKLLESVTIIPSDLNYDLKDSIAKDMDVFAVSIECEIEGIEVIPLLKEYETEMMFV